VRARSLGQIAALRQNLRQVIVITGIETFSFTALAN
jgi:hypothetical protein